MKTTKRALIAACIMATLGSLGQIALALTARLKMDYVKFERGHTPQDIANQIAANYAAFCHHLIESVWYLVITTLLVFAIRRLKNSN